MSKHNRIVTPSDEEVTQYGGSDADQSAGQAKSDPASAGTVEAPAPSEADEWRDQLLRAKAELANYQKRAEKERQESLKYANSEFARALLPLVDDLDRLLKSAAEPTAKLEALVEGVRLTRDNFLKLLNQFKVIPIEAQGQPFDPNVHEALMQQPSEQHAEPTVLQEVGRGYKLHDRVLRPAKVIVSKGAGD
jgi:molecular chaperone GrpE